MQLNERVRGKTTLLGLLGNPVAHSVSPQLHNTISDLLGKDAVYIACKVEADKLEAAAEGLRSCGFLGFNITVPYKEAIVGCCDELSPDVLLAGSANTVKNRNGRLHAYNTDGSGFIRAIKMQTGSGVTNKKAVVLGAGGTTRSIAVKLAQEGASSIAIINRTVEKARVIEETINSNFSRIASSMSYGEAEESRVIEQSDIIINTTSIGLHPDLEGCPLSDSFPFNKSQTVYDVIYKPVKTRLLRNAEKCGCITANGLGMLICQGVEAYEIWMDVKIPEEMVKSIFDAFTNYSAE